MDDDQKNQAPALIKETDTDIPASGSSGTAQPPPVGVSAGPVERKNPVEPVAFQEPLTTPPPEIGFSGEQQEVLVPSDFAGTGIEITPQLPPVPGIQPAGQFTPVQTPPSGIVGLPTEKEARAMVRGRSPTDSGFWWGVLSWKAIRQRLSGLFRSGEKAENPV